MQVEEKGLGGVIGALNYALGKGEVVLGLLLWVFLGVIGMALAISLNLAFAYSGEPSSLEWSKDTVG